ncbi:MAG: glycosyltransferase family 2 protein [Cytophagales bacterium]|jgi:GT2 family glycosyltransferase|nr:glycosyltransferase family 2 protein [Cytophagales bacterium]MCA6388168.1 glycosyltransferase family 2 protein [Cytophagales bacterium]MCA6391695.1 glycosyltransferase family 2 protein [Cytophagales bacterium]MCA6393988.1 glycosyltransferase family 2 protein [Cytophagales bacterium]MCA6399531.1 glycosyltransferase family 2 protein [Cytophagales bacterium]
MSELAVVILNYNGKKFLEQFLPTVILHSEGALIVVADNGSSDDSVDFIRSFFPSVQLISIERNLGFCGGYNFALKQVSATYYVLLNSDVEVTNGWLHPIVSLFNRNPTIAAIQPKILSFRRKTCFEYAGAAGGYLDALGYPFCRGRIFDKLEEDHGQFNDTVPIFWATGACHFVRSTVFHEMGGLDEDYFAHMEEIDFCWRLKRAGYQIYFEGGSTVYHVGGGTLSSASPKKTYLNFRNGMSLIFKHLPPSQLIWKLPLRVLLDWAAAVKFLLQPSPKDFLAVLKAQFDFFKNIQIEIRKRRGLARKLNNFNVTQIYPKWLVVDYFLLGKIRFNELRF